MYMSNRTDHPNSGLFAISYSCFAVDLFRQSRQAARGTQNILGGLTGFSFRYGTQGNSGFGQIDGFYLLLVSIFYNTIKVFRATYMSVVEQLMLYMECTFRWSSFRYCV